jgi:periplasmic protein TonB
MRYNSLKFVTGSVIAFVIFFSMTACNNESGSSSTTTTGNGDKVPDSISSTNPQPAMGKKKTGKVSADMTAKADANTKMEKDKMGYYNYTEVLPEYSGGQTELETYINNNIEYPQEAIDNSAEGTVRVQFAVDEKGNISNVKTIGNKIGYGLEEEAIKVVAKMPKWSSGQIKGKNVKTWRILPITYKLES